MKMLSSIIQTVLMVTLYLPYYFLFMTNFMFFNINKFPNHLCLIITNKLRNLVLYLYHSLKFTEMTQQTYSFSAPFIYRSYEHKLKLSVILGPKYGTICYAILCLMFSYVLLLFISLIDVYPFSILFTIVKFDIYIWVIKYVLYIYFNLGSFDISLHFGVVMLINGLEVPLEHPPHFEYLPPPTLPPVYSFDPTDAGFQPNSSARPNPSATVVRQRTPFSIIGTTSNGGVLNIAYTAGLTRELLNREGHSSVRYRGIEFMKRDVYCIGDALHYRYNLISYDRFWDFPDPPSVVDLVKHSVHVLSGLDLPLVVVHNNRLQFQLTDGYTQRVTRLLQTEIDVHCSTRFLSIYWNKTDIRYKLYYLSVKRNGFTVDFKPLSYGDAAADSSSDSDES